MRDLWSTLLVIIVCGIVLPVSASASVHGRLGVGYSGEIRENKDLSQFEVFGRQPLKYNRKIMTGWYLRTALEGGAAYIKEWGEDNSAGRFSLMPQLILEGHDQCSFLVGFGAGIMVGDTEFTEQNLGGPFFFSSKLGFLFHFTEKWWVEYTFYHQSNAGLYDYNASLNMIQLALSFRF